MATPTGANVMTITVRADTEQARNAVTGVLVEAQKAAASYRNELASLRQAQIASSQAINSTRESYHRAAEGVRALRQEINTYSQTLDKLKGKEKEIATAINELTRANAAYQKSRQASGNNTAGDNEVRALKAAQTEVQRLTAVHGQLGQALSATKSQITFVSNALETSKGRLGQEVAALNATKTALNAATDAGAKLTTQTKDVSAKLADANNTVRQSKAELQGLERQIRADDKALKDFASTGITGAILAADLLENGLRQLGNIFKSVIIDSTLYAGRTQELDIALTNVAKQNGYNIGVIKSYERAIKQLGITTQDTRDTLIKLVAADLDISKAPALARVAQDLAVIAGVDTSEEINRLVNGIETLQIRALRTAGVFVSLDGVLDKTAKSSGRMRDSFSEQEKQMLLMNAVLDYGARATGTYEKAMETASKQMRTLNRLTGEAMNAFGGMTVLQAAFYAIIQLITVFLKLVGAAPAAMTVLVGAFAFVSLSILRSTSAGSLWANKLREIAVALKDATVATFGYAAATNSAGLGQGRAASLRGAAGPLAVNQTTGRNISNFGIGSAGVGLGLAVGAGSYMAGSSGDQSVVNGIGAGIAGIGATALAAGAVSGGVGALIVAVGALVPAIYSLATASKEYQTISAEVLDLQLRRVKVTKEDIATFTEMAASSTKLGKNYMVSVEEHRQLQMAVERLNAADREAITVQIQKANVYGVSAETLGKLAEASRQVNNQEIKRLTDRLKLGRDANDLTVKSLVLDEQKYDALLKLQNAETKKGNIGLSEEGRQGAVMEAERARLEYQKSQGVWSYYFGEGADDVGKRVVENRAKVESFYKAAAAAYDTLYPKQEKSIDLYVQETLGVKETDAAYASYVSQISLVYKEQQILNGKLVDGVQAGIIFKKQLDELKPTAFDVGNTAAGLNVIFDKMTIGLKNATDAVTQQKEGMFGADDAIAGYASALKSFDEDLKRNAMGSQESYDAMIAGYMEKSPEVVEALMKVKIASTATVKGIGDDQVEAIKRLRDVQTRLIDAQREIRGLIAGDAGDGRDPNEVAAGKFERMEASLKMVRQEVDNINNLRLNLGMDLGDAIPASRELRLELAKTYENAVKLRDNLRALARAENDFAYEVAQAQQSVNLGIISASNLAAKTIAENQRKRIQDEQQLTADIIVLSAERANAAKNEIRDSDNAYKSYYKSRLEELEKVRQDRLNTQAELRYAQGDTVLGGVTMNQYSKVDLNLPDAPLPTKEEIQSVQIQTEILNSVYQASQAQLTALNGLDKSTQATTTSSTTALINANSANTDRIVNAITERPVGAYPMPGDSIGGMIQTQVGRAPYPMNYNRPTTKDFTVTDTVDKFVQKGDMAGAVQYVAQQFGIRPDVAARQILTESSGGQNLTSPKGAKGAGQFMQGTFNKWSSTLQKDYGIDKPNIWNKRDNFIAYGLEMQHLLKTYGGDYDLALSGYNAGEGATNKYLKMGQYVPFKETTDYRNKILRVGSTVNIKPQAPVKTEEEITRELAINAMASGKLLEQLMTAPTKVQQVQTNQDVFRNSLKINNELISNFKELSAINMANGRGFNSDAILSARSSVNVPLSHAQGLLSSRQSLADLRYEESSGYHSSDEFKQQTQVNAEIKLREERKTSIENLAAVKEREKQIQADTAKYTQVLLDNAEADRIKKLRDSLDKITVLEDDRRRRIGRDSEWESQIRADVYSAMVSDANAAFDELEAARVKDELSDTHYEMNRLAIAQRVEAGRINEARKSKDRIIEIQEELRDRVVNADKYVEEASRKANAGRVDAFKDASDTILALNAEDAARAKYSENYRLTATLEAEAERRKAIRSTSDDFAKYVEQENSNWATSIEYKTMLEQKFYVERRSQLQQMRDSIFQANEDEKDAFERMQLEKAGAAQKAANYTRDTTHAAILQQIEDLAVLEDASQFHMERVTAGIVGWAAKQKGVTELVTDSITGTLDAGFGLMDQWLSKLTASLGPFGDVVKNLFSGFAKLGIGQLITAISGGDSAGKESKGILDTVLGAFGLGGDSKTTSNQNISAMTARVQTMYVQNMVGGGVGGLGGGTGNSLLDTIIGIGTPFFNRGGNGGRASGGSAGLNFGNLANFGGNSGFGGGSSAVAAQNAAFAQSHPALASLGVTPGSFQMPRTNFFGGGNGAAGSGGMLGNLASFSPTGQTNSTLDMFGNAISGTNLSPASSAPRIGAQAASGTRPRVVPGQPIRQVGGGGGGLFGKFSPGIANIASSVIGAFGTSLGGTSTTGTILGTAGGILGGTIASALISGGVLFGSGGAAATGLFGIGALTGAATLGIGLAITAALMLGAYIFGKQKQRKADEKTRSAVITDALGQLNTLLENVKMDKMSGDDAITQAESIRKQYVDQMSQLKDGKTRRIALKDVSRLDGVISQIRSAAESQKARQKINSQIVPEFAGGTGVAGAAGSVGGRASARGASAMFSAQRGVALRHRRPDVINKLPKGIISSSGHGFVVPGQDFGFDSVPALLKPREAVINEEQIRRLGGYQALYAAGVPNIPMGAHNPVRQMQSGGVSYSPQLSNGTPATSGGSTESGDIYLVTDRKFAEEMVRQAGGTVVEIAAQDYRSGGKILAAQRRSKL